MESKFKARVTVRAVSVSRQTPPRARWGSAPIPFDITGETGYEVSVIDAKREEKPKRKRGRPRKDVTPSAGTL